LARAGRRAGLLDRSVLFNTLAFAKFFALVFVVSWLLVTRRHA
jgi:hypothetical protein